MPTPESTNRAGSLTLSCEHVRALDRLAVEHLGIPGVVLMENAGRGAAERLARALLERTGQGIEQARVAILCGGGNNGGDGYTLARHLARLGASVMAYALKPRQDLRGDARINAETVHTLGLLAPFDREHMLGSDALWSQAHVVVDAMLGTGFRGQPRSPIREAIRLFNDSRAMRVALDVPSGLQADTGEPAEPTVRAELTITFAALKRGFEQATAQAHLGRVEVADIGLDPEWLRRWLPTS